MNKNIWQYIITMTLVTQLWSCGEEKLEDKVSAVDVELPQVISTSLALATTGTGLGLVEGQDKCDGNESLGIYQLSLGAACHAITVTESILYGSEPDSNNDGRISCADYDPNGSDQGLLLGLLCEPGLQQLEKINTLRFSENNETFAISFEDVETPSGNTALGHWTVSDDEADRYPAKIRIWKKTGDIMRGVILMDLVSKTEGQLYIDLDEENITLEIDFKGLADTSSCKSNPSAETCHQVTLRMLGQEGIAEQSVPTLEIKVLGEGRFKSNFGVVEGDVRLDSTTADVWFADNPVTAFRNTREIYFRTVLSGNEIWGSNEFLDGDSNLIDSAIASYARDGINGVDYAGLCLKIGNKDAVPCTDTQVNADLYTSWEDRDSFTYIDSSYELPVEFGEAPSVDGIVTE